MIFLKNFILESDFENDFLYLLWKVASQFMHMTIKRNNLLKSYLHNEILLKFSY